MKGAFILISVEETKALERFATEIRIGIMEQLTARGFGHLGGCMSIADVLSVLYGRQMKIDPKDPQWEGRDWLICSKGHAGPAVYAALALKGYFPMDWLKTLNQPGTHLPSHCDRNQTPGIDMTTGSLGQGLSVAAGVALAKKVDGKDNRVFCIIGDGESQEGQIWEAISYAVQMKLDNLVLIIDNNKQQIDKPTAELNNMEDYEEKLRAFHWYVQRVDGHDYAAMAAAFDAAAAAKGKPSAIVLETIKGKGCSFALDIWNHHIPVTPEQGNAAIAELKEKLAEI